MEKDMEPHKKVLHLATMFLKAAAKICDLESLDE